MNTTHLKSYALNAGSQFMEVVAKRAAHFGIYEDEIAPVTFEGSTAIIEGKAFTKRQGEQRKRLEKQVSAKGFELFIREMAYTWFNRLAALRYMELHDYLDHGFRVLSNPSKKDGLPEILDHAADVADMLGLDKSQIIEWQLAGDKQEVLYRELLLGQCHHLHSVMPFLFEAIDDATELLLPDNLTKTDSILKGLVNDIPEEDWQQIEVIGWLYQFYISEHKDAVIGKAVKSEDIPAATQLFTPNWIVKYLVQNSIGRQWLATYPESSIKAKMEYYIEPAEQTDEVNAQLAAITPSSIDPESIKALDPACGSGHILVEMYEVLREIYLERGYRLREIPELILTKNIYGLDIDDRAAQLAGFALLMKAREDDRRIFQRVQDGSVKLNVYALQSTEGWDTESLWQALNLDGKAKKGSSGDLFAENAVCQQPTGEYADYFDLLKYLIVSFEQAKTLGTLIQIDHKSLPKLEGLRVELLDISQGTDPTASGTAKMLLPVVEQSIALAQKYDAVIANPPYMGSKGMNAALKSFTKINFTNSKADLFATFMERAFLFLKDNGFNAQVNMQSWMFLTTYEKLRTYLLGNNTLITLSHLGARAFAQISGEVVQTVAWVFKKRQQPDYKPTFFRLTEGNEGDKKLALSLRKECITGPMQSDFEVIPTSPIAYWLEASYLEVFAKNKRLSEISTAAVGQNTGNNDKYLRYWFEIDYSKITFSSCSIEDIKNLKEYWVPYNKGGRYRKWYGNFEYVIFWPDDGKEIKDYAVKRNNGSHWSRYIQNLDVMCKEGLTWSDVTSGNLSARYLPSGFMFDASGPSAFFESEKSLLATIGMMNTDFTKEVAPVLNSTIHFQTGNYRNLPFVEGFYDEGVKCKVKELIDISKRDWDSREVSWDFEADKLIKSCRNDSLSEAAHYYLEHCKQVNSFVEKMESWLTERFFESANIDAKTDKENIITLFTNPKYVIGDRGAEEQWDLFSALHIKDYISYFIGCAMGRYSLDRNGLVCADSNNQRFKALVAEGAYRAFPADDDGIIPLASEEWLYEDDATARFREFVKTVWGAEHLQENLEFIAESLCLDAVKPKKGESAMETICRYFSTQFFADHCKMYKKRPIYWLFSSGKEKAFECLVYLHRYNEATLSRMRTEYVTPLMGKYDHQLAWKMEEVVEATGTEQRRIEKEIKDLEKKQAELRKFDEELKHYAEMRITLDLDDGVKQNYGKFGNLLANVKGIHGKVVK